MSHWKWIVPTLLGGAGIVAVRRRKRLQSVTSVSHRPKSTYWQHARIAQDRRDIHIEALARMISSEAGTQPDDIKLLVGWIARNRSISIRRSMAEMGAPNGAWGPITDKRPFSTSQPATNETRTLAREILDSPQRLDPSGGATHGFNRVLQDELARRGDVANDSAAVIDIWTRYHRLTKIKDHGSWTLYR